MHVNCSKSSVLCRIGICGVKSCAELFTGLWKPAETRPRCWITGGAGSVSYCPRVAALCWGSVFPKPVLHTACPHSLAGSVGLTPLCGRLSSPWPRNSLCNTAGHQVTTKRRSGGQEWAAHVCRPAGAALGVWGRLLAVGLVCPSPGGLVCPVACRCSSQSLLQTKALAQQLPDREGLIYRIPVHENL